MSIAPGWPHALTIDVALMPATATASPGRVFIVVDQVRASTTIVTALDLGCRELLLAGDPATARRLREGSDRLLAGEQQARKPADFDFDNSPAELARASIEGRGLVLCTTNGTAVVDRLRDADHVLIGCLANAQAVAAAAVVLAPTGAAGGVTVVCAGQNGAFVLEDAIAAGSIVGRIIEAAGGAEAVVLTDAARAALALRAGATDLVAAITASDGGATLVAIGCDVDIAFCAREDVSTTVPRLAAGDDLRILDFGHAGSLADGPAALTMPGKSRMLDNR